LGCGGHVTLTTVLLESESLGAMHADSWGGGGGHNENNGKSEEGRYTGSADEDASCVTAITAFDEF
jgi:hypothetical protein